MAALWYILDMSFGKYWILSRGQRYWYNNVRFIERHCRADLSADTIEAHLHRKKGYRLFQHTTDAYTVRTEGNEK
jgi:hypothetical protein